ncbi:hypothetical protein RDI58_028276 [Solanum bulbocastanum]|uniref:glutathione transferase n=1 Tax=Solanum bulbocastanum TaxID=147425 RepID=A0AAN8Y0Z9_SOLBU
MATPVKVYGPTLSTAVSRVLACLLEKNVQFQLIPVNMAKGEHKKPDYLKIQAKSRSINRYICDKYGSQGNKGLYGTNPLEKASIDQWIEAEGQSFNPPSSVLVFQLAFAPRMKIKQDENLIRQNEEKLKKVLDVYEKRLGDSQYLAGDEFTLADLSHLPNIQYLVNGTDRAELFTSRENVGRWWGEISSRESWKKPFGQVPAYQDEDLILFGNYTFCPLNLAPDSPRSIGSVWNLGLHCCLSLLLVNPESRSINRYICDKYGSQGNKGLYGTNPLEKASIDQWIEAEGQSFYPPSSVLVFQLAFAPRMKIKQDENLIRQNEEKLKKVLDVYEKRLGNSQYLAGDEFTLADLSHLPNIQYLVNGTDRADLFTSRESVGRWWGEISSRESWKKEEDCSKILQSSL